MLARALPPELDVRDIADQIGVSTVSISHSHSLEGKAEGTGHSRQVAISSSIGATIEAYDFIG